MPDDEIPNARIKSWHLEGGIGKGDALLVSVRFWGGGTLVLKGEMGGPLAIAVLGPNAPADLYEVAQRINHELGMPWTDPRTGVTHEPPPMLPSGVVVREATNAEQFNAILAAVQRAIHNGEATHDCGEWVHGHRCGACGKWLDSEQLLEAYDLNELPKRQT